MVKTPWKKNGYKYDSPLRMVKLFKNAAKTEDSRIWNLNRVVLYRGNVTLDRRDNEDDRKGVGRLHPNNSVRKSSRPIKPPRYLKDFV